MEAGKRRIGDYKILDMTLARFLIFAFAFIVAGVAAFGQPSTRLRLTQIQDAPDTTNAYFIVAGQGDTILYKADIISIDSSGRVFTVVIGTDTIRWEDTTGGSADGNGIISALPSGNVSINAASNDFIITALDSLSFASNVTRFPSSTFRLGSGTTTFYYGSGITDFRSATSMRFFPSALFYAYISDSLAIALSTTNLTFNGFFNIDKHSIPQPKFLTNKTILASTYDSGDNGRFAYNTTDSTLMVWVGDEWRNLLNDASGDVTTGYSTSAARKGEITQNSGSFGTTGDAQTRHLSISREITGRTAALLLPDGSSETLTIPSNTVWICRLDVVAVIDVAGTGSSVQVGDYASYSRQITIRNNGGTTSLIASTTIGTDQEEASVTAGTLFVLGDDTGDTLQIYYDPDNTAWATDSVTRCVGTLTITQVQY